MAISLEVWGDYACFTRPEFKAERVSYPTITPSAARGLLESIYWHPGMDWVVDRIQICSPIRYTNIMRNEVSKAASASKLLRVMGGKEEELFIDPKEAIMQRSSMILKDVRYVIDAHFVMTENAAKGDNPTKFQDIIRRRIESGRCYRNPYFGLKEFPANFKKCEERPPTPKELMITEDLGWMLYGFDYSNQQDIKPKFFRAEMVDGVIDVAAIVKKEGCLI